ncbi:unnamed protein product [Caenorhabditis nigoni]
MMKIFFFAALLAVTHAVAPIEQESVDEALTGKDLVDYVNSAQSDFITEHVDVSEEFMKSRGMNVKYAAAHSDEIRATEVNNVLPFIPPSFDSRTKWSNCTSIKNVDPAGLFQLLRSSPTAFALLPREPNNQSFPQPICLPAVDFPVVTDATEATQFRLSDGGTPEEWSLEETSVELDADHTHLLHAIPLAVPLRRLQCVP